MSKIADEWIGFLKGVGKGVSVPCVSVYELLLGAPAFWDLLERIEHTFEGTVFDSYQDIIYQWKVELELARRSWTREKARKQWRIGYAPSLLHLQYEGLYWGLQRGDSLIHDLREEDHYYFTEYNDFVFDHGVDGLLEGPSDHVLSSLGVRF